MKLPVSVRKVSSSNPFFEAKYLIEGADGRYVAESTAERNAEHIAEVLNSQAGALIYYTQSNSQTHYYEDCPAQRTGDLMQTTLGVGHPDNLCQRCRERVSGLRKSTESNQVR